MAEIPLRAHVAEALGCRVKMVPTCFALAIVEGPRVDYICGCDGDLAPHGAVHGALRTIAPYGEDSPEGWACTGPLMERLGFTVGQYATWSHDGRCYAVWPGLDVSDRGYARMERTGATRAEAAANLIVALAEAGRLPK